MKPKDINCLTCQMLRDTTNPKIKLCGCWLNKGDIYTQPTSVLFLEKHKCMYYTGSPGVYVSWEPKISESR